MDGWNRELAQANQDAHLLLPIVLRYVTYRMSRSPPETILSTQRVSLRDRQQFSFEWAIVIPFAIKNRQIIYMAFERKKKSS